MELVNTRFGKVLVLSLEDAKSCGLTYSELQSECRIDGYNISYDLPIAIIVEVKSSITYEAKVIPKERDLAKVGFTEMLEQIVAKQKKGGAKNGK